MTKIYMWLYELFKDISDYFWLKSVKKKDKKNG